MQVRVFNGGDMAADALLYKPPSQELVSYLQSNVDNILTTATNISRNFVDSIKSMYNAVHNAAVTNYQKLVTHAAGEHLGSNVIIPLSIEKIPNATPFMQEYVMAEPTLNDLYRRDMCYGYGEYYAPVEKGLYGKDTATYSEVMSGVLQFDEDGNGFIEHIIDTNSGIINPDGLHYMEKLSILETWDAIVKSIAEGVDPTSGEEF